MKEKLEKQKGITLIALIISIIVMLILAVVSINIIINQGIMTKSKDAADTHQVAAEKEAINIGYSEYLTKKYNGETNLTLTVADANVQENANEWTITFNAEPKNVYKLSKDGEITKQNGAEEQVPQELVVYLVGDSGKSIFDLMEIGEYGPTSFKDTGDANLQLDYINYSDGDEGYLNIIFMYKDKLYYVSVDTGEGNTKEVKYIGNKTEMPKEIKEGAKLRIDGINYTILYVNNDNTVEIVADAIGYLTLGREDEKATGNNEFEKAVNSYNNAIERINDYCASLYKDENENYKNSNIISVRSIGSNRSNPYGDTNEMYTDSNLASWNITKYYGSDGEVNESVTVDRVGKVEDNNYEEDYNKMKELGIEACGKHYWLASRRVDVYSNSVCFYVGCVRLDGDLSRSYLWDAFSYGNADAYNSSYSVRPVLKMNISALSSN